MTAGHIRPLEEIMKANKRKKVRGPKSRVSVHQHKSKII